MHTQPQTVTHMHPPSQESRLTDMLDKMLCLLFPWVKPPAITRTVNVYCVLDIQTHSVYKTTCKVHTREHRMWQLLQIAHATSKRLLPSPCLIIHSLGAAYSLRSCKQSRQATGPVELVLCSTVEYVLHFAVHFPAALIGFIGWH